MKKLTLCFTVFTLALTGSVFAGGYNLHAGGGKNPSYAPKNPIRPPVAPPVSTPKSCYGAGMELGIYAAAFFPGGYHYDEAIGGGISLGYFFNENIGVDLGAAVFSTDSEVQLYTLDLVYRIPINCVAPYVFAGGGVHTNSQTEALGRAGAGIDFRISDGFSIFADGAYNIPGGDLDEYTTVRAGIRIGF